MKRDVGKLADDARTVQRELAQYGVQMYVEHTVTSGEAGIEHHLKVGADSASMIAALALLAEFYKKSGELMEGADA